MRQNARNLRVEEAKQTQDTEGKVSKGSSGVCLFPARLDTETRIAKATAKKLNIPFVDPLRAHIEPAAVSLIDSQVAMRRQVLPIRLVDDTLLVAMASPGQSIAVRSLELLTGCKVCPAASPKSSLLTVLRQVYGQPAKGTVKPRQEVPQATREKDTEEAGTRALTLSVISNKGGVGKTHFSINLASALAKTGARVLLIDADLGSADISNKLGIFPKHNLLDFLNKDRGLENLVVPTKFHFDLICGACGELRLANLYYAQKVKFLKHFKVISQDYDFAVFDLSAGIGHAVLDFALGADQTVIVTTPQDLVSGYACAKAGFFRFKEIEERLEGRLPKYIPSLTFSPILVINQVNYLEQGVKIYDGIKKIIDENVNTREARFRMKPEYLGSIPYDRSTLRTAEEKRRPFLFHCPYVKASQCVEHMSKRFYKPEDSYKLKVSFKHPFRRFLAIAAQKI